MEDNIVQYTKYTIETTAEAEDIMSAVLADCGIEGIEIEDSTPWTNEELDEIFVDEVPLNKDIPEGVAYISFYLSEEDDIPSILSSVRSAIEDMRALSAVSLGSLKISSSEIKDEDYINSWKQFFHAFSIDLFGGRKLGIIPSWEESSDTASSSDLLIHIDPGTAFGTGAHETTRLCITELSEYVKPGMKILDVGTGSGILAMASFLLDAGRVTATELDKNAPPAVEGNFEKNGLKDADFELFMGDLTSDSDLRKKTGSGYDIVVANILPIVLIPLTGVVREFLKEDGILIYSGILTEKAPAVRQALKDNGLHILKEDIMGEWCAIVSGL